MPDTDETKQSDAQGVTGNDDGTVLLRIGTDEWVIRVPTFKEYRDACLASDKAMAKPAPILTDDQGLTDPVVHSYLQWAPARFAWWRKIIGQLSDTPFPKSDDALPLWLASAEPINDVMGCWLRNPQGAPGG